MKTKTANRKCRYCPFPSYDVEGLQCWLEDQAEKGWFLRKDGFFGPFARLERGTPCHCRYRLLARVKRTKEDDGLYQMAEEAGWELVAPLRTGYLYRTQDPNVIELHTDPQVQALEIHKLRRHMLIWGIVWAIYLWAIHFDLFDLWFDGPLTLLLRNGTTYVIIMSLTVLLFCLFPQFWLGRQEKKLRRGIPLTRSDDWKRGARSPNLYYLVLLILVVVIPFCARYQRPVSRDYNGPLPFAAMEEVPALGIQEVQTSAGREWKDLLAPQMLKFNQDGELTLEDGTLVRCSYYANYYHTVSDKVAKQLFRESEEHSVRGWEVQPVELENVGIDQCSYSRNRACSYYFFLRKGEDALSVWISFFDETGNSLDYPLDVEAAAAQLVDSLI